CSRLPSSLLICSPEPEQGAPFPNLKPNTQLTTSDFFDFSFFLLLLGFIRNTFSVPFNIPDQKKVPRGSDALTGRKRQVARAVLDALGLCSQGTEPRRLRPRQLAHQSWVVLGH